MISFLYELIMMGLRFLLPLLKLIPHEKIQYFVKHQGQITIKKVSSQRPIWIHASSGEIEYAQSLIRDIRKTSPDTPVLVTHTSLSSLKALQKLDIHAYGVLPLDDKKSVQKFLDQVQPRVCLLARTDLWPQMIEELKRRNISCCLFSATFAKGSKKTNWISRLFLKPAIQNLSQIYFVGPEDQKLCESLYGPLSSGKIMGDTRYDQVTYRLQHASPITLPPSERILLLGSTWQQDEKVLSVAVHELRSKGWKFIWVPHEVDPQHLEILQNNLQKQNLSVGRFSKNVSTWNWQAHDVLLVDQMGLLASLYPFCQVAFVGGSFKKQVHSVMEPLAAGCPVLVGPYHYNNREALEFKDLGYVFEFSEPTACIDLCQKLGSSQGTLKTKIISEVEGRTGATGKLINELKSRGVFDAHALEPIP